jgi:putative aldouronate transport system substrate-binding protein
VHWVHQELLDEAGLPAPTSAVQYKQVIQAVTGPQSEVWGIGIEHINQAMGLLNGHFSAIHGAPNNWRVDSSGKMSHTIENNEFRQALGYARDLYAAGIFNPNSLSYDTASKRNDFTARRFAFDFDGFQNASILFWQRASTLNPPAKYRIVPPFSTDSTSKPIFWSNTGIFGYSILQQAAPERIKEILRVLNYIAAPFGTHEHLLMHYGVEGVDAAQH